MKKYINLFLFLLITVSVKSQNFKGTVLDTDNKALEGAIVVIYNDSLYNDICITDSLGRFSAYNVPDTIIIKINHIGYLDLSKEVLINKLIDNHMNFYLEKSYTVLNEVVVYAKPPTIKKDLGKFIISNIAQSSFAKGNNTHDFLTTVPILNTTSSGDISILNKTDPAIIYINGRPSYLSLKSIPAKNIEKIEVIAIPGAEYSASNKQGVINIVLKKQIDEGLKLTVGVSDAQSYYNSPKANIYLSYSRNKINLTGSISGGQSKSYFNSITTNNYLTDNLTNDVDMKFHNRNLSLGASLNLDYHITNKQTLGLRLFLSGSDSKIANESNTVFRITSNNLHDSIYLSTIETKTPEFINSFGSNISYDLKLDENGSLLKSDFTYIRRISNNNTHGLYQKISENNVGIIRDDYLQNNNNKGHHYVLSSDLSKKFENDNKLNAGISINYSKLNDQLMYSEKIGTGDYINDPNKTNSFLFKDITGAAYIVYEKAWDAIEASVGLRSEYYWADGLQKINNKKVKRDEFDFFPSLSLYYTINDNHEISLDASRSVFRPSYNMLNPFKLYTSPTTYIQNNPDLKSAKDHTVMLSYMFFNDYMFDIEYEYSHDVWGEFSMPDENGLIKRTPFNYGNAHSLAFTFIIQKSLFKGYWNINSNIGTEYDKDKGAYNGIEMNNDSWRFTFRINNNVFLSKKKDWQAHINYRFRTKGSSALAKIPFTQDLELRLQKIFANSTLSISASNIINRNVKIASNVPAKNYSYTQLRKSYPVVTLMYSYTFGNKKVKTVNDRYDQNVRQRAQ